MRVIIEFCFSSQWLLIATLFAFGLGDARADARPCSSREAFAAEQEASTLRDWDALYRSYEQFSHCDDGAISEGYSYSVAWLLTDRWEGFGRLLALAKHSSHFEDFVVSHINETMSQENAKRLLRNLAECPPSGEKLCSRLKSAVAASS
ncbi:MAG: hypothetical protein ACN6O2_05195 [Stenotrophomonas sp.]